MAENIVLQDRSGDEQTYEDVIAVEVENEDGETVRYGGVNSVAGVPYDPTTGDVPLTANDLGSYTKEETSEKIKAATPDLSGYCTRSDALQAIENRLASERLDSQSDWSIVDTNDAGFVANRTHYDTRSSFTFEIGSYGDDTVEYAGLKWEKLSDVPIAPTIAISESKFVIPDNTLRATLFYKKNSTNEICILNIMIEANKWINALLAGGSTDKTMVGNSCAYTFAYCKPYEEGSSQYLIDSSLNFVVWILTVREDLVYAVGDGGEVISLDGGTYIHFEPYESGIDSGTIIVAAGELKQLDEKYMPDSVVKESKLKSYYTAEQIDKKISNAETKMASKLDNYYTAEEVDEKIPDVSLYCTTTELNKTLSNYPTMLILDKELAEVTESSQSDVNERDSYSPDYIKNRTHFDTRTSLTWELGSDSDSIEYGGKSWQKISDDTLTDSLNLLIATKDGSISAPSLNMVLDTGELRYALNFDGSRTGLENLICALNDQSGALYAYSYCTPYGENQEYIDSSLDFYFDILTIRQGSVYATNDDGTVVALDAGTYIAYEANNSGITSGTVTIAAGELKQLDEKFLPDTAVKKIDLNSYATTTQLTAAETRTDTKIAAVEKKIPNLDNYYNKEEVDTKLEVISQPDMSRYYTAEEVAKQIAAILPAFSAADEGKVLGIQNGVLAWVTATTSEEEKPDIVVEGSTMTIYDVDCVVQEGSALYLYDEDGENTTDGSTMTIYDVDCVVQDGSALYLSDETEENTSNGATLTVNDADEVTQDGSALYLS